MNSALLKNLFKIILQLLLLIGSILIIQDFLFFQKTTLTITIGILMSVILLVISLMTVYRIVREDDLLIFIIRSVLVIIGVTFIFGAVTQFGLNRPFAEGCILAFKFMLFAMLVLLTSQIGKKETR